MPTIRTLLTCAALLIGTALPLSASAQTPVGNQQATTWTDGEIRKLDLPAGKLTIKHGPILNLDMPGMTMVFVVKDKALLDKVKVGDKIRFSVIAEDGKMIVTAIQPAPLPD